MTDKDATLETHIKYICAELETISATIQRIEEKQQTAALAAIAACEQHRAVIYTRMNEIDKLTAVDRSRFKQVIAGISLVVSAAVALAVSYLSKLI